MSTLFSGPPGSGKSTHLRARAAELSRDLGDEAVVLHSPPLHDVTARAIQTLALPEAPSTCIDEARAFDLFVRAAQPLLELGWTEFSSDLDPEVAGLRSPERFLAQAFSLIGKLESALMKPSAFLDASLRGATTFYGTPPNFSHPPLLLATAEKYRGSLAVENGELARQHKHEVALARILAKLYADYRSALEGQSLSTYSGRLMNLVLHLRTHSGDARRALGPLRAICIDDVQNCTFAEIELLRVLSDEGGALLCLAGDADSSLARFRGARPEAALRLASEHQTLSHNYRRPSSREVARPPNQDDEADTIARWVQQQCATGTSPNEILVVLRSMERSLLYENALVAHGITVQTIGACNPLAHRDALDALAPLFFLAQPERNEWLLRLLASPTMALSDASLATLCGVPQAQIELVVSPNLPSSRDPLRYVRLMQNVLTGERDGEISSVAAQRISQLRSLRNAWLGHSSDQPTLVRRIWNDVIARKDTQAAVATQRIVLGNLFARIVEFFKLQPKATLDDFLHEALRVLNDPFARTDVAAIPGALQLRSIDAISGMEFACVVVANAKAGSFPRWYVPDAFLFSPQLGIVPRDNVGDAKSSRTAKITYYLHSNTTRDRYNKQERLAFEYALSRATRAVLVTASGRPTSGRTAPEFCDEFRTRPGVSEYRG